MLITSAGEFRRDSEYQFSDETGKDDSGSESLLMTQHAAGSLANFFHSQESTENRTNTTQGFQNLIKTKAGGKD